MQGTAEMNPIPLHALLDEASRALTTLDADRLEELSLSCQALNRTLPESRRSIPFMSQDDARATHNNLVVLGRVLEVTRGNLAVIRQISAFESGMLEYASPSNAWVEGAARDGND